MSEKRRDNKKRILRNGESQRTDGRYAYKYIGNDEKPHFVYSWKLEKTDSLPYGKRDCEALREQEKRIEKELTESNALTTAAKLTVYEFAEKYIESHKGLRDNTVRQYRTSLKLLNRSALGNKDFTKVTVSDAKAYAVELSKTHSYGSTQTDLTVLKAAFSEAVENGILRFNPFIFKLSKLIKKDTIPKGAVKKGDKEMFLDFCSKSSTAKKSLDGIIILFGTGMRISELCGLTLDDVDINNKIVFVRHQIYKTKDVVKLVPTKSPVGVRIIPMSDEVCEAFKRIITNRNNAKVPEYANFLFLTSKGIPMNANDWDARFHRYMKNINKNNANKLAPITPHSCRHTFCSDMALDGMNLKILQRVMGHSSFQLTVDRYTHISDDEEIVNEFHKIGK